MIIQENLLMLKNHKNQEQDNLKYLIYYAIRKAFWEKVKGYLKKNNKKQIKDQLLNKPWKMHKSKIISQNLNLIINLLIKLKLINMLIIREIENKNILVSIHLSNQNKILKNNPRKRKDLPERKNPILKACLNTQCRELLRQIGEVSKKVSSLNN